MWIRLKNNDKVIKYIYFYTCTTITCHCLVGGDDREDYRKDKHKKNATMLCKNNNFREIVLWTRITIRAFGIGINILKPLQRHVIHFLIPACNTYSAWDQLRGVLLYIQEIESEFYWEN